MASSSAKPFEAIADSAEVRESAAQPALADVRHAAADRFALDDFVGLPLGADEKHQAALG